MHRSRVAAVALLALALLLPACGGGGAASPDIERALQTGAQLREGCVASALELLQNAADMVSLAVTARDLDTLDAAADAAGCTLSGPLGGSYTLFCPARLVRGESASIVLELTYVAADGFPTDVLADAVSVIVAIEAESNSFEGGGLIQITPDPALGLIFDGFIGSVSYDDGCSATADLEAVTGQTVADLPDLATGVLFTSGDVDLGAETPEGQPVSGSAGLVGRTALIVLDVDGVISQGEIALGE